MKLDIVGPLEVAERLGVKNATVRQWKWRGLMPEPAMVLSGVPAWHWRTILGWALKTGRTEPGRYDVRAVARSESDRCTFELENLPLCLPGNGAEWDWWPLLHDSERARLRRRWMRRGGLAPDQLATVLGYDVIEAAVDYWLDLTRRADVGRNVSRPISPDSVGGFTIETMFGGLERSSDDVSQLDCELGPAPAELGFDGWWAELLDTAEAAKCAGVDDWSTPDQDRAWRRYLELMPTEAGELVYSRPHETFKRVLHVYKSQKKGILQT